MGSRGHSRGGYWRTEDIWVAEVGISGQNLGEYDRAEDGRVAKDRAEMGSRGQCTGG
jgi:hypothetical protein